jgi:hypothetical protein
MGEHAYYFPSCTIIRSKSYLFVNNDGSDAKDNRRECKDHEGEAIGGACHGDRCGE